MTTREFYNPAGDVASHVRAFKAGQVWSVSGQAFVAFVNANWTDYKIISVSDGGGNFHADVPDGTDTAYLCLTGSTLAASPAVSYVDLTLVNIISANSIKLETIRTGLGYTGAGSDNAKAALAGVVGGGNLYVEPFVVSYTNPMPASKDIFVFQYSSPSRAFTVLDATGAAVNLTGKQIRFTAAPQTPNYNEYAIAASYTGTIQYDTSNTGDAAAIVIGGPSHNVITVTPKPADTATSGQFLFWLWDITSNTVLFSGKFKIAAAVKTVA